MFGKSKKFHRVQIFCIFLNRKKVPIFVRKIPTIQNYSILYQKF